MNFVSAVKLSVSEITCYTVIKRVCNIMYEYMYVCKYVGTIFSKCNVTHMSMCKHSQVLGTLHLSCTIQRIQVNFSAKVVTIQMGYVKYLASSYAYTSFMYVCSWLLLKHIRTEIDFIRILLHNKY